MTLQEAADNIGQPVNYVPHPHHAERGVITAVTSRYVFVRYDGDGHAKATAADELQLVES